MTTLTAPRSGKQIVLDLLRSINEGRVEDLHHHLASDVIDHNKVIYGEADRPGAAFDGFRQQLRAFSEARMRPRQLLAEGDTVMARLLVSGVHTGFHPRMPAPTHRSFAVEQIWVFTIREDRITEIRAVSDRLGMFLQLHWDWPAPD